MFFLNQSAKSQYDYERLLKIICSLSKLFSENGSAPYLYYRIAEKIFCKSFNADDLTRSDISIDAKCNNVGVGLKTFLLKNGKCLEKVAEFNKQYSLYNSLSSEELINKISELRNERIKTTCNIIGLNHTDLIYHSIVRSKNQLLIDETCMHLIDVNSIKILKDSKDSLLFRDINSEYSFNKSKSTLFKRFEVKPIHSIDVCVEDDPFKLLSDLFFNHSTNGSKENKIIDKIVLPLYSVRKEIKYIPERSGLNQWNANGRARNHNEIYIPIKKELHNLVPNFFPCRESAFTLKLPSGRDLKVKVCQDNDKALMSHPNSALGEWLLRDVLNISIGSILTYEMLLKKGIDSVQINKYEDCTFEINFKRIGTFEDFLESKKNQ